MSTTAADTRARILDTALGLFGERGFEGTTLQQIADLLGVTKAALYYHFKSKDDLLEALVAPAITSLEDLIARHEASPDTPARRRRFIEDYIDTVLAHRRLLAYMASDLATVAHPMIATGSVERKARLEALMAGDGLDFCEQIRITMAFRGIGGAIAAYPSADTAQLRAALLAATASLLKVRAAPQWRMGAGQRSGPLKDSFSAKVIK